MTDLSYLACFVPGDSQYVSAGQASPSGSRGPHTSYPEPVTSTTPATASPAIYRFDNRGPATNLQHSSASRRPTVENVIWTPHGFLIASVPQAKPPGAAVSEASPPRQLEGPSLTTTTQLSRLHTCCQPPYQAHVSACTLE